MKYFNFRLGPKQIFILFGELAGLQMRAAPSTYCRAGSCPGDGGKIHCLNSGQGPGRLSWYLYHQRSGEAGGRDGTGSENHVSGFSSFFPH